MRGKDVESKRTAQAALTLLVEYCGAHSQDSSVRRELPACRLFKLNVDVFQAVVLGCGGYY